MSHDPGGPKRHPSLDERFDPAIREHELRHLAIRDFLQAHSAAASSYEVLKRELVGRFPQDRLEYIAGKERHLSELQALALEWARRR